MRNSASSVALRLQHLRRTSFVRGPDLGRLTRPFVSSAVGAVAGLTRRAAAAVGVVGAPGGAANLPNLEAAVVEAQAAAQAANLKFAGDPSQENLLAMTAANENLAAASQALNAAAAAQGTQAGDEVFKKIMAEQGLDIHGNPLPKGPMTPMNPGPTPTPAPAPAPVSSGVPLWKKAAAGAAVLAIVYAVVPPALGKPSWKAVLR